MTRVLLLSLLLLITPDHQPTPTVMREKAVTNLSYELSGFLVKLYMIFAECLYAVARNHYALTLGEYPDLDSHMLEAHPWQVRG